MTHPDPLPLVARGLAVFPIPAGAKRAEPGWQARCTTDLDELARTWPTGANIGIGCRTSGIVGLDLDRHRPDADGIAAFEHLCRRLDRPQPHTFTVRTPHGRHLYFVAPPGIVIPSSICRVAPGIDVRAPGKTLGGYLVGPGSVVNGLPYEIEFDVRLEPLPGWLTGLLARTPQGSGVRA